MMLVPTPMSDRPTRPGGAGLRQPVANASHPLQSTDLFKGQKSLVIEHNGSIYRLQATKLGKLILTK